MFLKVEYFSLAIYESQQSEQSEQLEQSSDFYQNISPDTNNLNTVPRGYEI